MDVVQNNGIAPAPNFTVVREVSADDAELPGSKKAGINCADFDEIVLICSLTGEASAADVEAHYWADAFDSGDAEVENGAFVPDETPVVISVDENGLRKVLRVGHHGSVFFEVSGLTGDGGVRIEAAGIPVYGRSGG